MIPLRIRRTKPYQWACGKLTGHVMGNDSGFWVSLDGYPMRDYWCKYCDKKFTRQLANWKVDAQDWLNGRVEALLSEHP